MNTKSTIHCSFLLIVFFIGFLAIKGLKTQKKKEEVESAIQHLPTFHFYQSAHEVFDRSMLKKDKATLVIYFHPECDHCQYQIKQLTQNATKLEDIQVLLISNYPPQDLTLFYENQNICLLEHTELLWDRDHQFESYFGKAMFPTILIYGKNMILKKKIIGETKIENILTLI